jgi:nucleotide-binding universal stress UspA family protein
MLDEELGRGNIVIGGRGLGTIRRTPLMISGVSESVIGHAHCPVFMARGWIALVSSTI